MSARRLLIVGSLTVALVGCGGEGSEVSSELILDAAEATLAEGSAAFDQTVIFEGSRSIPDGTEVTGFGASSFGSPTQMQGSFDYGAQLGTIQMIVSDSNVYFRGSVTANITGDPDLWLLVDVESDGEYSAFYRDLAAGAGANDISLILSYLYGLDDQAETIGSESIGGVAATGYRTSVSVSLAAMEAPYALRDSLQANLAEIMSSDAWTELDAEIWIDRDGLIRRVVYVYELGDESGGGRARMICDLSEFGEHESVETPDPSEVVSEADVA
jgi:hypothetical protein